MATNKQIVDYIEGTVRQFIYNRWPRLLKSTLIKEYEERKDKAQDCLMNGECLHCGCKTPDVFFTTRGCLKDEPCYTELKTPRSWILKLLLIILNVVRKQK